MVGTSIIYAILPISYSTPPNNIIWNYIITQGCLQILQCMMRIVGVIDQCYNRYARNGS